MKVRIPMTKPIKITGLKTRTSLKAGDCCWDSYRDAFNSDRREDWDRFYDCCRRNGDCSY